MPSEKFRITTNGQSLRNPSNGFFGMTLSANMTLDESDVTAHNDRRSAHNALERQRREHLNVKFQQLAHALPALQTVRRPSKTMIVAKSLEFVSSSLKRETTFTSEIQKLRLENEKLRKQAEASSNQLKKQIDTQKEDTPNACTKDVKKKNDDDASETSNLIAQEEKKPSLKRKASMSDPQLSPPPTPEAMRGNNNNNKPHPVVIATPVGHQNKKKKMVKQTKELPTTTTVSIPSTTAIATSMPQQQQQLPVYMPTSTVTSMINTPATSLIDSPWSPIDESQLHSSLLSYPPNSTTNNPPNNTPNYFDMTSPSSSNAHMLYDLYSDNIHPMLLAPYYIPNVEATTNTITTTPPSNLYNNFSATHMNYHRHPHHHHQQQPQQPHQRQQSGHGHDFYLS